MSGEVDEQYCLLGGGGGGGGGGASVHVRCSME